MSTAYHAKYWAESLLLAHPRNDVAALSRSIGNARVDLNPHDNRFITESIVPKMREEKRRRQFVFATHNANIPVLGDAELIVGLAARSSGSQANGALTAKHMGAIDSRGVGELVEEVLEGGRRAFELRGLKYGF